MNKLAEKLSQVCEEYVGATGKTFLQRQCKFHLNIDVEQIEPGKLDELSKWCEISGGLIIGKEKAQAFKQKVLSLKSA